MPRLPRVELVLGGVLDDLTEDHLQHLIDEKVSEAEDLDFKKAVYWVPKKDELGKDVAALANHVGGLLLIGIGEDGDAQAVERKPFSVDDALERQVQEIVADYVHPPPLLKTRRVDAADGNGGYLLIAVPRSPLAPHAVQKPGTELLGYPVRSGTGTRWLTETEVADRYRGRFREGASTVELVEERATAAPEKLALAEPWLVVSVTPDVPGSLDVDAATGHRVGAWLRELPGTGLEGESLIFDSPGVRYGPRHFVFAHQQDGKSAGFHVELYDDGGSVVAFDVSDNPDDGLFTIPESRLTRAMVAALGLAATYAVDIAGSIGTAIVRAEIVEPLRGRTGHLEHSMILKGSRPAGVGGWHNYARVAGTTGPLIIPSARATVDIGSVRRSMPERIAAAYLLLRPLVQGFGLAEPVHITSAGALRVRYFHQSPAAWATASGVELDDTTL